MQITPKMDRATPLIMAKVIAVWMLRLTVSRRPAPRSWATTTVILFAIFFVIRKKAYARVQSFSLAGEDVTQL